ncbi:MAG: cell division topological specificity factor MinE [Deltaproteobacteria bacterium]|nr:cell division topological specificity factor MinE [Deltaproteobacteria bacterium]
MFSALKDRLFGDKSNSVAKGRLHVVLVQDRSGLNNEEMADFRQDLVKVLQTYFVIDDQGVEVSYERESDSTTLVINTPVLRRKPQVLNGKDKTDKVTAQAN